MQKILIIRLSSMGDIVLTSPIIRSLKLQQRAEIHYLLRPQYSDVLKNNPYVDRIIPYSRSFSEIVLKLKSEEYDFIVDLQGNLISSLLKYKLKKKAFTIKKETIKKLLFIYFNINLLNSHVVDRYFKVLSSLKTINDNKGLDFFLEKKIKFDFDIPPNYIAWSIGGSYDNKQLSVDQISSVCDSLSIPIVFLGGTKEEIKVEKIRNKSKHKSIHNLAGKLSIDQSAFFIKNSLLVLTNDTGLMHIASSFKKIILSFWGCTKPNQGFRPYMADESSREIVYQPSYAPCSKYGKRCKWSKSGCVKNIKPELIINNLNEILLESI
ncbi:MAG: glycosyl transferase [Flavobacteriales bacterium]|nr:glycosyl transferase [Flavobacteriales bacterium]